MSHTAKHVNSSREKTSIDKRLFVQSFVQDVCISITSHQQKVSMVYLGTLIHSTTHSTPDIIIINNVLI